MKKILRKTFTLINNLNWEMKKGAPLNSEVFFYKYIDIQKKIFRSNLNKISFPIFQTITFSFLYYDFFGDDFLNLFPFLYSLFFLNSLNIEKELLGMSYDENKDFLYFGIYDKKRNINWVKVDRNSIIIKNLKFNQIENKKIECHFEISFKDLEGNYFYDKTVLFSDSESSCAFIRPLLFNTIFEQELIN